MKIALGADSSGFALKEAIKKDLLSQNKYEIVDTNPDGPVYYADAACSVAQKVQNKETDRGIVICGTGMGVSIIANKHKGVYAALCESIWTARRSKAVNNTNVLCMGGYVVTPTFAVEMANAWLNAEHLQGIDEKEKQLVLGEFHSIEEIEEKTFGTTD